MPDVVLPAGFAMRGEVEQLQSTAIGQCYNSTIRSLLALNLEEIGTRVHFRSPAVLDNIVFPAAIVSPFDARNSETNSHYIRTTVRVLVSLVRAGNRDMVSGAPLAAEWLEQTLRMFSRWQPATMEIDKPYAVPVRVYAETVTLRPPEHWARNYNTVWLLVSYDIDLTRLEL